MPGNEAANVRNHPIKFKPFGPILTSLRLKEKSCDSPLPRFSQRIRSAQLWDTKRKRPALLSCPWTESSVSTPSFVHWANVVYASSPRQNRSLAPGLRDGADHRRLAMILIYCARICRTKLKSGGGNNPPVRRLDRTTILYGFRFRLHRQPYRSRRMVTPKLTPCHDLPESIRVHTLVHSPFLAFPASARPSLPPHRCQVLFVQLAIAQYLLYTSPQQARDEQQPGS